MVVHPLKAFTHYADLSVSEYSEGHSNPAAPDEDTPSYKSSSLISSNYDTSSAVIGSNLVPRPPPCDMQDGTVAASPVYPKHVSKKSRKYSSTLHVSLSTQNKVSEHTTDKMQYTLVPQKAVQDLQTPDGYESIATPLEEKQRLAVQAVPSSDEPETISAPASARNSLLLDDYEASDEEESVSITTGRLSLSLSAASINVKSEVIQTAQVPATEHEQGNAADAGQQDMGNQSPTDKNYISDQNRDKVNNQSGVDADSSTKGKSEGK